MDAVPGQPPRPTLIILARHTIEGERFALEMHLVHRDETGRIAVVGVLFREGEANSTIQADHRRRSRGRRSNLPSLGIGRIPAFLPEGRGYFSYRSSSLDHASVH